MSEWIDIKESWPKPGQWIVQWNGKEDQMCAYQVKATAGFGASLTHWLPIPEPPKAESAGGK